jgi:hypothetical protein
MDRLFGVEHDCQSLDRIAGFDASLGQSGDRGSLLKPHANFLDDVFDLGLRGFLRSWCRCSLDDDTHALLRPEAEWIVQMCGAFFWVSDWRVNAGCPRVKV